MSNTHQPDTGKSPADRKLQDRKQQDHKQQDRTQRHDQDADTGAKAAQGMPGRPGHLDQQDHKGTGGKPRTANPAADRGDGHNPKRPGDDEDNGEPGDEPAVEQDTKGGKAKKK